MLLDTMLLGTMLQGTMLRGKRMLHQLGFRKGRRSPSRAGEVYIWACAGIAMLSLLIVFLLVGLVLYEGSRFFWTSKLIELRLNSGELVLGQHLGERQATRYGESQVKLRVGNRDLYGQDFRWISSAAIQQQRYPQDAVRVERLEYSHFYGFLEELRLPDALFAQDPTIGLWERFQQALAWHLEQRAQLQEQEAVITRLNRRAERLRLQVLRHRAQAQDVATLEQELAALQADFRQRTEKLSTMRAQLNADQAIFRDAQGQQHPIALTQIIRALRPNAISTLEKAKLYLVRIAELLWEEPREANMEGGLYPAILGTVLMVLLMSVLCMPFGVITAVYLHEYAKSGWAVRLVRIAVYNLAGVPSIVFGMFGLAFFVYGVGGWIDQWFFAERLPTPTFGSGGILWASLTLGLLTVPVVIVSTEEGLTAVSRGVREASLALGATRLQTLLRVVLPMAMPGILTGFILAVARAAGETAPLMLTGVVKLAPAMPFDAVPPYLHLERKFMHLGFHIYDVGFQSPNAEASRPMVYVTTLLLLLIVVLLSIVAIQLRSRIHRRLRGAAF